MLVVARLQGNPGRFSMYPNHLHAPVSLESIAAGKHVLCEKPMATLLEDHAMIASAKKHNIKLMIGHNHRFMAVHAKAKEFSITASSGKC